MQCAQRPPVRRTRRDDPAGYRRADGATDDRSVFGLIGTIISIFVNRYRIVAVTDQRILVLDTGKWALTKARAVVTELPRSTRLGPPTGLTHTIETPSGKIRVRRPFFKDVNAADSVIAPNLG